MMNEMNVSISNWVQIKLYYRFNCWCLIHNPIITWRNRNRIRIDITRAVDNFFFVNTRIIRIYKRRFVSTKLEEWKNGRINACIPLNEFAFRICRTYKISLFPCQIFTIWNWTCMRMNFCEFLSLAFWNEFWR